jgi:hypothetical protein
VTTRRAVIVGAAATALAVLIWVVLLQWGILAEHGISDLGTYEDYSQKMHAGKLPYRDFSMEYPPLAAALFWLAGSLPASFSSAFSGLMLACLVATLLGVVACARALNANQGRAVAAAVAVACTPVLIGNLVETRFDLAFSAVLAWTTWAALTRRMRLAWLLLGVAIALKVVLLVLIPVLVIWHVRNQGWRPTLISAGLGMAVVAAIVLPFAVIAPKGIWAVLAYHLDRPLQLESLGGAYLLALHALAGSRVTVTSSFGSQGFPGSGPSVVAAISTALLVLAIAAIAITFARLVQSGRPDDGPRLLLAAIAATVGATLVFGKVLSPQFMLWLLPVAFLVHHRFGLMAFASGLLSVLLTLAYFPHHYWQVVALDSGPIAVVVLRDLMLMVFLAAAWPRAISRSPATMVHPNRANEDGKHQERAIPARYLVD